MKLVPIACATAALALAAGVSMSQEGPVEEPSLEEQLGISPSGERASESEAEPGEESDGGFWPEVEQRERSFDEKQTATLRALDKITGRSTDFEIKVGEPVVYGSLKIDLSVCYQTPPEEIPESAAFLKIETTPAIRMRSMAVPRPASDVEGISGETIDAEAIAATPDENGGAGSASEQELLFSGWMFASSPGLSALEHPVYDVWVIRCTERSPVSPSGPGNPAQ